jgi:hypothetical protein
MAADGSPALVFDAGALARVYAADVSTRSLRALRHACPGSIFAPSLAAGEIVSAWLQFVRAGRGGDGARISWEDYELLVARFLADVHAGAVQLVAAEEFSVPVMQLLEENVRLHLGDGSLPVLRAHDAYYLALARWLRDEEHRRAILVTLDRQPWLVAKAFGVEAFHANTCDLGRGVLNVGLPGHHFADGANCSPCQLAGCPSGFHLDLKRLPADLGSGWPKSWRPPPAERLADRSAERSGRSRRADRHKLEAESPSSRKEVAR